MDKRPSQKYKSPGCIDVLYMPEQHQEKELPKLRSTTSTTPGYSKERYDPERWVPTHEAARLHMSHLRSDSIARKRKRSDKRAGELRERHRCAWDAFRHYLRGSIPLKVDKISCFRDPDSVTASTTVGVLPCCVESFPSTVLDKMITVQCAFPAEASISRGDRSYEDIDRDMSFCKKNIVCPTFMGQENQITTEMTLRETLSFKWQRESSMAVSVAQEPIASISSSSSENSSDPSISIQFDGTVSNNAVKFSESSNPMELLVAMLRLPAYLLLGNPEDVVDDNRSSSIAIHDINLWHAPQNCASNVHYDDRDNLLMVTEGVKTVELCPPDCIDASPIYSEHANHPALLRRSISGANNDQRIQETLELKRNRTHIVSVSAGQALFIPSGWWHRVESAGTCTAVNVWFDYKYAERIETPMHMTAFRLRQAQRKYYESHETELAIAYLQQLQQTQSGFSATAEVSEHLGCHAPNLNLLRGFASSDSFLDDQAITSFIHLFLKCWAECMRAPCTQIENELTFTHYFADFMNDFLVRVRLDRPQQLQSLVKMWFSFSLPTQVKSKAEAFECLIQKLKPAACYMIAQAWEIHASSTGICNDTVMSSEEEVQKSYKHFFSMFRDDCREQKMRTFLYDGVEVFRESICSTIKWPTDL